jgi:hypothetical protein
LSVIAFDGEFRLRFKLFAHDVAKAAARPTTADGTFTKGRSHFSRTYSFGLMRKIHGVISMTAYSGQETDALHNAMAAIGRARGSSKTRRRIGHRP